MTLTIEAFADAADAARRLETLLPARMQGCYVYDVRGPHTLGVRAPSDSVYWFAGIQETPEERLVSALIGWHGQGEPSIEQLAELFWQGIPRYRPYAAVDVQAGCP